MTTNCKPAVWITTLALVLVSASSVFAQNRERDRDRDRRREWSDPAELLRRMDDNDNGIIEPNEVSSRSRSFIERAAERARLDMKQPMASDKLMPAMQQISEEYRKQQEGSSSNSTSPSSSATTSGFGATPRPTPAFGSPGATKSGTSVTSGFGSPSSRASSITSLEARFDQSVIDYVNNDMLKRLDKNGDGFLDSVEWKANTWSKPPEDSDLNRDNRLSREELCIRVSKSQGIPIKGESLSSSSSSSSSGTRSPESSASANEQYKKYAEGFLRQFDKDKNGKLERDEWKEMKLEHQGADSNGDGTITVDELVVRLAAYSSGGSSSSSFGSPGSSASSSYAKKFSKFGSDKTASTAKKSYRFLTPTERLPQGMPDWYLKSDADGDGQILMSEYSSNWTEAAAADFAKYDLNGDGIITPQECLAVEKK